MAPKQTAKIERREFLKLAGAAVAVSVTGSAAAGATQRVVVVADAEDQAASSGPAKWAAERLGKRLAEKGATVEVVSDLSQTNGAACCVVVAKPTAVVAKEFKGAVAEGPESTSLIPGRVHGTPAVLVSATDPRGFVYGLLELAERVQFGADPVKDLAIGEAIQEKPASEVRSIARLFCDETEDKPWYGDKEFWRAYLDAVAASRFNRFALTFGLGYDFPKGVTGDYFHFPYPYLVDVPGYKVRVSPALAEGERERNLEMLQFIGAETAARGLQFQLGLWTHAYEWTDSPHSDHHIEGLTAETHAPYCRDALAMLLKACPEIQGLTMRVHGESGIPEGSYPFWETLFQAIPASGRKIEIDMHAKGINQIMIDMATKTGMPVKVSAKWWAEHMGLGYHQADIRELEIPTPERMEAGTFSVSNGERRFTRYGYADLFQEERKFDVLFRLWPGTQRHLLWGDPAIAAGYGRRASFCGASGVEICEPLTFKGREGSGHPGGRCAYADASLNPKTGDFEKFAYTYRIWGRLLYNPDARPEVWQRYLRSDFGPAAHAVETALANASRVLPVVTTSHLPSAANHSFWPEIYENMPIVLGSEPSPYSDTPSPKCFATVSPLDPQLFSSIVEHADNLLQGRVSAKYSPVEVAQWLEELTAASNGALVSARQQAKSQKTPEFRRMEEDVLIQNGLGKFFAAKLRSGLYYEIYRQTGDPEAGRLALAAYRKARIAWAEMAERAKGVYVADISYGSIPMRRGDWAARLPNIDLDIAAMQQKLQDKSLDTAKTAPTVLQEVTGPVKRPPATCSHTPPATFHPGQVLPVSLTLAGTPSPDAAASIDLYYRHVNQAERWKSTRMERKPATYIAAIPADYTNSVYPLQYYFELRNGKQAWLYPALNATLSNQPYYAISKRS
jgi:hypothetical protein